MLDTKKTKKLLNPLMLNIFFINLTFSIIEIIIRIINRMIPAINNGIRFIAKISKDVNKAGFLVIRTIKLIIAKMTNKNIVNKVRI